MSPKRLKWTEDIMQAAVNSVVSRRMGYLRAAQEFSKPPTTLER